MTVPEAFQIALQHHQAGRLAEAEALYRQILAVQPNHADALHLFGVIAHQVGRHDLAAEWIRKAIAVNPEALPYYLSLGNALVRKGDLDQAIMAYRRAIQIKPDFPQGRTNLGNALRDRGQLDEAIAEYQRALEIEPDLVEAHNNLGNALRDRGRLDEAIAAYRRAIQLNPGFAATHYNLGNALRDRGHRDEAIAAYRRAVQVKPDYSQAHYNLGNALRESGQLDEAIAVYRRAVQDKPDFAEAHYNLGIGLRDRGQIDEAIAAYRCAVQAKPDFAEAHYNLGNSLRERGAFDEAIAACRRALELRPDYADAHNNLGAALREGGRLDEAIGAYRRALQLNPESPEIQNNLGDALRQRGLLDEAVAVYRRALELQPNYPEIHSNLGIVLRDQGELDEAIAAFRRALEVKPDHAGVHSNLVFTLHLHPGHDHRTISEEHRRWNRQFSEPMEPFIRPHDSDQSPERRLRVGYVSPDFRDHPVGRCVLPLFEQHDRERFDIVCYSGVLRPDSMTERLRALGKAWRNVVGVPDRRLAEMIREDGVDILVDLTMHTAGSRLPAFALRPAPVQAAWLAYPGSTGLPGIDYRFTDPYMDPPAGKPVWSTEEPVRLPDCWSCYQPNGDSPEINALPALSTEGVTFGSLNNFAKVNEPVLERWTRVLNAVKESRLLLFCPEGRSREKVRAFFGARGIGAERVELSSYLYHWEYLQLYQRIDLGLDPFPFNGITTTGDALWMGVPVLTLPGEMPASRAGLSILSTVGLEELVASSEEDYVRLAVELAGNLPRLADLRSTLRQRMRSSPLMDAPRFARNIEAAYCSMWQRRKV